MICRSLFVASLAKSLFRSPGPPPLKQPGCGAGSGKVVVGEATSSRQHAEKERRSCHEKRLRLLQIHLGRQSAHLTKSISAENGFGSGPKFCVALLPSAVPSIRLLRLAGSLPFLCPSSFHLLLLASALLLEAAGTVCCPMLSFPRTARCALH